MRINQRNGSRVATLGFDVLKWDQHQAGNVLVQTQENGRDSGSSLCGSSDAGFLCLLEFNRPTFFSEHCAENLQPGSRSGSSVRLLSSASSIAGGSCCIEARGREIYITLALLWRRAARDHGRWRVRRSSPKRREVDIGCVQAVLSYQRGHIHNTYLANYCSSYRTRAPKERQDEGLGAIRK